MSPRSWCPRPAGRGSADRGSVAIEAAIVIPALIVVLCIGWAAGRIGIAESKVDAAAQDAARAASVHRTASGARDAAQAAADSALADEGLVCSATSISVNLSGLNVPVGQVGTVTAIVRCTVDFTALTLPAPGSKAVTGRFTSTVDAYRQRGS